MTPKEAMQLAIQEAYKGWGRVYHNPMVGCVILNQKGELISKGFHREYGKDHAEVDAFKKAGASLEALKGATVFVTLEPCAHQGKTPSCAKTMSQWPIKKVVYGLKDPNPLVQGKGLEILKNAGIVVEAFGDFSDELQELIEIFSFNMKHKEPFVALKVATSLDGCLAYPEESPLRWITGDKSREHCHFLRAHYDAIVIGKNTLLMDNPFLTVRHKDFPNHKNKVVIFWGKGLEKEIFRKTNVYQSHGEKEIFLVAPKKTFEDPKVIWIESSA
ncbi:MAG: bifunctional diaminohydroxyphosphoribosylaminopyrimidine deaminase/5-amino-6-(5-phosphoribosylamino)uracil reductase RibD, partial [Bdellovibrio sp.]